MRDYLGLEFQELKETLPFEYNLESIIDDWVNFVYYVQCCTLIILYYIMW